MSSRALRPCLTAGCAILLALAGLALAPARAHRTVPIEGPRGRYIVTLDSGETDPAGAARRQVGRAGGTVDRVYGSAMKGYSASLPQGLLSQLLGSPGVRSVEPDVQVQLAATQVNPPTNLDRIDQRDLPLSRTFSYSGGGAGVRAYVIDTGTRADLPEFQGRVTTGYNVFTGKSDTGDCNGHGTHVAGIVASVSYGVAKNATIVPVKAFGCANTTTMSAIIAAVD
ncbi:MAG TPA: S8 family serine peptidase, partial [Acidimicrobiales bacterium]|nr:S8 family serine peptidase [Acidimicrobiales bacterium]